jgi:hypothetical protein
MMKIRAHDLHFVGPSCLRQYALAMGRESVDELLSSRASLAPPVSLCMINLSWRFLWTTHNDMPANIRVTAKDTKICRHGLQNVCNKNRWRVSRHEMVIMMYRRDARLPLQNASVKRSQARASPGE